MGVNCYRYYALMSTQGCLLVDSQRSHSGPHMYKATSQNDNTTTSNNSVN